MKEEFVTYEQALALKELGFDEPCFTTYDHEGRLRNPFDYERSEYEKTNVSYIEDSTQFLTNESLNSKSNFIIAPLKQQVFRWFRKNHGLYTDIFVDDNKTFGFMISYFVEEGRADTAITRHFETYEEAEHACLDKLIEMAKNK